MQAKKSTSLYLRVDLVEEAKKRGFNLSHLIDQLLEQFLFGKLNHNQLTEKIMRINEIERKVEEILKMIDEIKPQIEELKSKFQKEKEAHEAENDARLITLLKDSIFDDMDYLKQRHNKEEIRQFAEVRLSQFAIERRISLEKAWQLFYRAFPELEKG